MEILEVKRLGLPQVFDLMVTREVRAPGRGGPAFRGVKRVPTPTAGQVVGRVSVLARPCGLPPRKQEYWIGEIDGREMILNEFFAPVCIDRTQGGLILAAWRACPPGLEPRNRLATQPEPKPAPRASVRLPARARKK